MFKETSERRPMGLRTYAPIQRLAKAIAEVGVRPQWISLSPLGLAALSLYGFWAARGLHLTPFKGALGLVLVMLCILGQRLATVLARLVQDEVVMKGGAARSQGEAYWNEVPDRVGDLVILAGVGLAVELLWLGMLAGILVLFSAYLREFGARVNGQMECSGPLSSPRSVQLALIICLLAFLWLFFDPDRSPQILLGGLGVIILGTFATVLWRSWRLIQRLP